MIGGLQRLFGTQCLQAIGIYKDRSRKVDDLKKLCAQWGNIPRWCLEHAKEDSIGFLEDAVSSTTAKTLQSACRSENDTVHTIALD